MCANEWKGEETLFRLSLLRLLSLTSCRYLKGEEKLERSLGLGSEAEAEGGIGN